MSCGCTSNCTTCGFNPCQCGGRTLRPAPSPFYNQAGNIQETHCQSVQEAFFATAIASSNDFVMPSCNNTAIIRFPNVTQVQVGSYLWSLSVGYLKVTDFDYRTQEVTVLNECLLGNIVAGTIVPRCTLFNVIDSPYGISLSASTVTATGNWLPNAAPLTTRLTFVEGADGVKGVALPINPQAGRECVIYNTYNNVLKLYPGEVGDFLNGVAGVSISIPALKGALCNARSYDQWWVGLLS